MARLLTSQVIVIGLGAVALIGTAAVVGPPLFAEHLAGGNGSRSVGKVHDP